MKHTDQPIIVEQTYNTSAKNVWNAITNLNEMRQWFFENIESFEPKVGFETQFSVKPGERSFLHLWKLAEVIPEKKITYNWQYKEYPGEALVSFELFEQENQTMLRLTNTITQDFPQDVPEFQRESCMGGWNYFIKESLKKYINEKYGQL